MIKFENKVCSIKPCMCIEVKCAQFASCMFNEIEALDCMELHDESIALEVAVCNDIKENMK